MKGSFFVLRSVGVLFAAGAAFGGTTFTASGSSPSAIQGTVDGFRNALGNLNAPEPVLNAGGRRQINWDAAPDGVSAPNPFAGDFFNFNASPRARGIEFTTPGNGFQLSATAASGEGVEFDNINNTYSDRFGTFSPERLFTPLGSNVTDVFFFNPADQTTPALTRGFGAVFTDVDLPDTSRLEFYDANDQLIDLVYAPWVDGDETLSFVGGIYDTPIIARVRIYTGTTELGPDENLGQHLDVVALDDFIFGEPSPIPEPATFAALGLGAALLRRRRG